MRINFCEINEKKYTLDDIKAGDLFILYGPKNEDTWPDTDIYLKLIEEIRTEDGEFNCVNIINGRLRYVLPMTRICLYNSKVNFDPRKFEG
jgi:hypothetical protein